MPMSTPCIHTGVRCAQQGWVNYLITRMIHIVCLFQDEEAELLFTVDEPVQAADKQPPDKGGGGDANATVQETSQAAGI